VNATEARHALDERVQTDMAVALERACASLPPDLDTYTTRKFIAQRLIALADSGECRLTELTSAARCALAELKAR
jgi:hypothetical protein